MNTNKRLMWLEGKRIAGKGWVLLCFFAFPVLGILVSGLVLEQSFEKQGCSVEQYLEAAESCRGKALPEAAEYLEEKAKVALEALEAWQNYRMRILSREEAAEALMSLGYGDITPEDLTFRELWEERAKYRCVLDEVCLLLQYDKRMEEIRQGGGGLSGISFFSGDDYVIRTREKARKDYAGLNVVLNLWQPNTAVREFLKNRVMDCFIFLFLIVVVFLLYVEEREKGYVALTASTKGGRGRFYVNKAGLLLGFTMFTVLIYEGMLLIWHMCRLGDVVWSAPIQSVAEFEMCSHSLCAGTAILLAVIFKGLSFYILMLALSVVACLVRKMLPFLGITAAVSLLCVVWERTANINDSFGWLTCFNPVKLADSSGLLIRYRQISVLGRPVSELLLAGIFMGVLALVSFAAGSIFYTKVKKGRVGIRFAKGQAGAEKEKRQCRKQSQDKEQEGRVRAGSSRLLRKSLFWAELRKILLAYGMLLPVLAVILICAAVCFYSGGKGLTQQEQFYRDYMAELNGPLTPDKEQMILQERERFRNLEAFRDELILHGGDQALLLHYIESEMMKKSAFDLVEQQYSRVREEGGVFLYETGYLYLLGLKENESGRTGVFLSILLMTILLPYLSWVELGGGADELVRTARGGRGRALRTQYAVYFLLAVLIFGSICAEDTAVILRQFGSYGMTQAAGNMSQFEGLLSGSSIAGCLVLIFVLRLLGTALAVLLAQALLYRCRDYLKAVLLCGILLVLPCLLFMSEISFMSGYFMNAFLQGDIFLLMISRGEIGSILSVLLQTVLCVGAALGILRKEVKRR